MITIIETTCDTCGKIYKGKDQIEVCGNCGNERYFTIITADSSDGDDGE